MKPKTVQAVLSALVIVMPLVLLGLIGFAYGLNAAIAAGCLAAYVGMWSWLIGSANEANK